jgi:hypothetical protein
MSEHDYYGEVRDILESWYEECENKNVITDQVRDIIDNLELEK